MSTRTHVAGLLMEAKSRLTSETWGKAPAGHQGPPAGKCCLLTALSPCTRLEAMVAKELLYRAVFGHEPIGKEPGHSLAFWNDAEVRTLADVHAAYDRAIASELGQS